MPARFTNDPSIPANSFAWDFLCFDLVTVASITFPVIYSLSVLSSCHIYCLQLDSKYHLCVVQFRPC